MPAPSKQKLKNKDYGFRSVESVRASTVNEESRTIEATLSTEKPVEMFDYDRWEVVPEVLLSSGMRMSASKQVPFLDSHNRYSTVNQIGSVRDVVDEGGKVRGVLHFSSVNDEEFTKAREGHATDVSVGYRVINKKYIEAGKTKRVQGREFTGPLNVVTEWRLQEVSLTPIGADDQAKLRGLDQATMPQVKDFEMNDELRKLLVESGMSADLSDDDAQRWLIENKEKLSPRSEPASPPNGDGSRAVGGDGASLDGALSAESVRKLISDAVATAVGEADKGRSERQAKFRSEVDAMVELSGVDFDDSGKRSLYDLADIDAVRTEIVNQRAQRQESLQHTPSPITFGRAQKDKHLSALKTALTERCVNENAPANGSESRAAAVERIFPKEERAKDAGQFRNASLYDLALECLRMDGIDVRGLNRNDVAMVALGFGDQIGVRSAPAYHTTGSFAVLTQDAINKSMMLGQSEYPSTWRGPMRQGSSVADFKTIHRMQLGAVPNLPVWNDSKDPDKASMSNAEETYAVECRSLSLDFNYKLLVNDDMDVISRQPFKLGIAASRTVNTVAWSRITGNRNLRDSKPLFSAASGARKRSNLTTGSGAPSAATIQTLTDKMMQMRGENTPEGEEGPDVLGLTPRYLILPSALRTTGLQVVRSIADPSGAHAGVVNINNDLVPIVEPLLDANSTTAWYLFAEPTQVETVEVTFLQGQETPQVRMIADQKKLSQEYIILQTFEAKELDHRGVQRHDGA